MSKNRKFEKHGSGCNFDCARGAAVLIQRAVWRRLLDDGSFAAGGYLCEAEKNSGLKVIKFSPIDSEKDGRRELRLYFEEIGGPDKLFFRKFRLDLETSYYELAEENMIIGRNEGEKGIIFFLWLKDSSDLSEIVKLSRMEDIYGLFKARG